MMIRGMMVAGAVAAGLFSSAAQADAVYEWHQESASASVRSSSGRIVLSDAALAAGLVAYQWGGSIPNEPDALVRDFAFTINGWQHADAVDVSPVAGSSVARLVRVRMTAIESRLVDGAIRGLTADANVTLSGNAGTWMVAAYGTEGRRECFQPTENPAGCFGATGRWQRVPEPGVLPLLALGAFGVAASMRRRQGQ